MKTFISWQGNKTKHIKKFIQYIPEFEGRYIEPFVGSGAMLLKLEPEKWIINDINKDLINIYKNIKDYPYEIINEFKNFGINLQKKNNDEKLKECKKITNNIEYMEYDIKRSAMYMLMKQCSYIGNIILKNEYYFGGLCLQISKKNHYRFLMERCHKNILEVSYFFNNTQGHIYNKSYEQILTKAKEGDFVFLDPPYIEDHDYQFNYNKDEILNKSFINKLLKELQNLDDKGVKWLMTQADTPFIRRMFKNYTIKSMKVYRRKNYVTELIIFNYDI